MFVYLRPFFFTKETALRETRWGLLKASIRGDLESAYKLGRMAYKAEEFSIAQKLFEKVCKGPSHDWYRASLYLGTIAFNSNQLEAADYYWKQAADSGEPTSMYNLGILHKQKGDIPSAIHWFERAWLKHHPKAKQAFENLKQIPRPDFNPSPREAEILAAKWMIYWGYRDAEPTPVGPDGGIDVISSGALAQVKYRGVKTTRREINEFHGSAEGSGKEELFFSLSGYTHLAISRANEKSIALFVFEKNGIPYPLNYAAKKIAGNLASNGEA